MDQWKCITEIIWVRIGQRNCFASVELWTPNNLAANDEPPDGSAHGIQHKDESHHSNCTTYLSKTNQSNLTPNCKSYDNHEAYLVGYIVARARHWPRNLAMCTECGFVDNCACATFLTAVWTVCKGSANCRALRHWYVVHLVRKEPN